MTFPPSPEEQRAVKVLKGLTGVDRYFDRFTEADTKLVTAYNTIIEQWKQATKKLVEHGQPYPKTKFLHEQ